MLEGPSRYWGPCRPPVLPAHSRRRAENAPDQNHLETSWAGEELLFPPSRQWGAQSVLHPPPALSELSGEQEGGPQSSLAAEWPEESQFQDKGPRCVTSGRGCRGQLPFSLKAELGWETAGLFAALWEVVQGNPQARLAL